MENVLTNRSSSLRLCCQILWTFVKIGAFTLGGGYAMLALMEKEIVHGRNWLTRQEFLDVLAVGQSAPGPIAVNGAVFIGYKIKGLMGATFALLGVILPSFVIILVFAVYLAGFRGNPLIEGAFKAIRPATVALILGAVYKLGKSLKFSVQVVLASLLALAALILLEIHPIIVIVTAALAGIVLGKISRSSTHP